MDSTSMHTLGSSGTWRPPNRLLALGEADDICQYMRMRTT